MRNLFSINAISRYWTLRKFFQKKQPLLSEGGREAICSSDLSFLRLLHSEALLAGDLVGISIKNVFYFAFSDTEKDRLVLPAV